MLEIVEVQGFIDGNIVVKPLYQFVEASEDKEGRILGTLQKKGELTYVEKLQSAGLQ